MTKKWRIMATAAEDILVETTRDDNRGKGGADGDGAAAVLGGLHDLSFPFRPPCSKSPPNWLLKFRTLAIPCGGGGDSNSGEEKRERESTHMAELPARGPAEALTHMGRCFCFSFGLLVPAELSMKQAAFSRFGSIERGRKGGGGRAMAPSTRKAAGAGDGKDSKYRRMDAAAVDGEDDDGGGGRSVDSGNRYVVACAVLASLNSVLLGYDVGVMSGAIIFIQKDLHISEVQQEVLVGCLSIMSLLGSLGGGRASDAVGRKWTIGLAAVVFQAGAATMALAPSFAVLITGRLIAGIGIGFGVVIAPVYIAEISPAASRGSLTSYPEICINLGILLGYVSNYAFSGLPDHISWRVMLGVGILPSVLVGFALLVIPESPRWLVMRGRVEEARSVLLKTSASEAELEDRVSEIEAAASSGADKDGKSVWRELLSPSPSLRRMLITGCGIQSFQQITGIDATVYYSPTIFRDAGIESDSQVLAATVAVGFTKTVFILVAIFLIDRTGRKPLLYVSTVGMTLCLLALGVSLTVMQHGSGGGVGIGVAILAVCGNVAFFSVGIGPVCWVVSSEIFPLRLRAQATALGAVGNRLCSGLVAMSFLSVSGAITVGGTFLLFSAVSATSVIFVWYCVPETKGKSLEQIEMLFQVEDGREWQRIEMELADVEHVVLHK